MSDNPFEDPEFIAWADVAKKEMLPKLAESGLFLATIGDYERIDMAQALQLGAALLLDKPLLFLVEPGSKIPEHLARCADEIIEFDAGNPEVSRRIADAIHRMSS